MSIFQIIMLGFSAYFAYKIYEHMQTLRDPKEQEDVIVDTNSRTANTFSTFDARTLVQKADDEREKQNLDRALAIYHEANLKDKNNAEILFKMAYTLALQDRNEEALEYFLESLKQDDKNPFTYKEIAKIYEKLDDKEQAEMYNKRAVELDEDI